MSSLSGHKILDWECLITNLDWFLSVLPYSIGLIIIIKIKFNKKKTQKKKKKTKKKKKKDKKNP